MKKYVCAIVLLSMFFSARAQDCNIGNEDTAGYDNAAGPFWANYLLDIRFTLTAPGTLQSINLIATAPGAQVQMAVYEDALGAPGNLVSASSVGVVVPGITSLPVSPVLLNPGSYWVMAIYGSDEYNVCNHSLGANTIYYTSLAFGNPIPLTGAGFTSYTGGDFAYFLEIACLSTGENNISVSNHITVYPNPASGYIYVSIPGNDRKYSITDMYGRLVEQGTIQNNNEPIAIQKLSSGIYFLDAGRNRKVKFIKN